ncbi:MAG TPA: beta-galactosidase [candidate division Zixibacteria bacterium]|nr:beta-galactosidase [candidate division Zixibacteria bacterium]
MLGVIGNKFSIGKETYHPFSAELHYFRIDKRYWSICFERIKRAGFRIISTAVPWNVHQDASKHVDFSGFSDPKKDLVVFLELAREFGFKVILRPGPWVWGQLEYGGLPKYLFNDIKLLARDCNGQEQKFENDHGVETGYLPSYLHKTFQFHLKTFFRNFIEVTKNYVHPRGPVFMVELDYETSFGRRLDPGSADYNPDVVAEYYPRFLEDLYEDIKKLNAVYREKNETFDTVEPPRKFTDLEQKDFCKVLDWMRFREYMLREYLEILEDVFTSYTVEPLIYRSLYFQPGDILPAFNLVPDDRQPFLGANVFPDQGNYFDLSVRARFLKAEYGFAFATSFVSGAAAADAKREQLIAPVTNNSRRFYLAAALSSGFKGLNHYMFVDRDHWYGAPLHNDGTISDGYDVASKFNQAITEVGLEEMDTKSDIAVVGSRLYYWLRGLSHEKIMPYLPQLLNGSTVGFCRDLMRLKLSYGIRENRDWESIKNYRLVFVPTSEVMPEADQEAIVELAKAGCTVVLCGLMPRYDEYFRDCQTLANHFRIRTTVDYHINTVSHKNGEFPCNVYGSIRSGDESKVKKLCKAGSKVVGVCSSRFKGQLFLFSFDIASGGNHQKLAFLESVLESTGVVSYLYCSDPSVDISFHVGEKKSLLFVVAPPPGQLSDGFESGNKDVIIKADLKAAGMKAAKVKLTNLFDGENAVPIKTTAKDLKGGIQLNVTFPDGHIYLVERRP